MSHQFLGLRDVWNEKKSIVDKTDSTFFKKKWGAPSVAELFAAPDKFIAQIPEKERWNMFYTVASCTENKREFSSQSVIMFDLDGINTDNLDAYISAVCTCLGLHSHHTGIVFSGNGLHFAVGLTQPITEAIYFDKNRRHYKALCEKINGALAAAAIPGKADPAVFDPRRIMRLPGTENRKEGKQIRVCSVLQGAVIPRDFDLAKLSGLPDVTAADHINPQAWKKYPKADKDAVCGGCNFLKWMKEEPNKVSEAQWYAGLSILARVDRDAAHDHSKGHKGYSFAETETKIDQALAASGPRTCANINSLWGNCSKCPFFEKLQSPITLQGEKFIKTRDSGFFTQSTDANGNIKQGKPCYSDLVLYFAELHPFIVNKESLVCFVFNGTHWEAYRDSDLMTFAQDHFKPAADTKMANEFSNLISRSNPRPSEWFSDTTRRKMNFRNGVLDLDTMELHPHSPAYGFRSVLGYDYDPTATAPMFEKFLMDVMADRKELTQVLLEFAGYAFSGDNCWAQKALILQGTGANGKSTFMDTLGALAGGEHLFSSLAPDDLSNDQNLVMLDGALFNLAEEMPRNVRQEGKLKNLISGGKVLAKILYKQPHAFANRAKLIFSCNELPHTKDASDGFFRRFIIVPFDRKYKEGERDDFIGAKLLTELPGIFNLIIEGYKRLQAQRKFTTSGVLTEVVEEFRRDTDTVSAWVDDRVNLAAKPEVRAVLLDLYKSYAVFAGETGNDPENYAVFTTRFGRIVGKDRRKREIVGGRKDTVYYGVSRAE